MERDEREDDLDLLQELKRSRLRLKYNWENLFKKYENITESGIEVQLDTFEVYAPVGMNRKTVVKEVEKHEFLGSQFGASVFSAPGNEDSLEGCHPKIVEKCRKMDKEFSKINNLLAVVPHRQKLKRGPCRGRQFFIRKTIREDVVGMKPRSIQCPPMIAIDAGMSDGPLPSRALKAIEGVPEPDTPGPLAVACRPSGNVVSAPPFVSAIPSPSFILDGGLSDGPISSQPEETLLGEQSSLGEDTLLVEDPTSSEDSSLPEDSSPPEQSENAKDCSPPETTSSQESSSTEVKEACVAEQVMIDNGLSDGPVNLTSLYDDKPSTSRENLNISFEPIDFEIVCENLKIRGDSAKTKEKPRAAVKRISSESIENEVDAKKLKKDEDTQSADGLVLDLSIDHSKSGEETYCLNDNFWTRASCENIISDIVQYESKSYSLFGVPLSQIDSDESLLDNWARYSEEGIEYCQDGQDYVSREERRLMSNARRRNSFLARGSAI